jgi:hypothetical protein
MPSKISKRVMSSSSSKKNNLSFSISFNPFGYTPTILDYIKDRYTFADADENGNINCINCHNCINCIECSNSSNSKNCILRFNVNREEGVISSKINKNKKKKEKRKIKNKKDKKKAINLFNKQKGSLKNLLNQLTFSILNGQVDLVRNLLGNVFPNRNIPRDYGKLKNSFLGYIQKNNLRIPKITFSKCIEGLFKNHNEFPQWELVNEQFWKMMHKEMDESLIASHQDFEAIKSIIIWKNFDEERFIRSICFLKKFLGLNKLFINGMKNQMNFIKDIDNFIVAMKNKPCLSKVLFVFFQLLSGRYYHNTIDMWLDHLDNVSNLDLKSKRKFCKIVNKKISFNNLKFFNNFLSTETVSFDDINCSLLHNQKIKILDNVKNSTSLLTISQCLDIVYRNENADVIMQNASKYNSTKKLVISKKEISNDDIENVSCQQIMNILSTFENDDNINTTHTDHLFENKEESIKTDEHSIDTIGNISLGKNQVAVLCLTSPFKGSTTNSRKVIGAIVASSTEHVSVKTPIMIDLSGAFGSIDKCTGIYYFVKKKVLVNLNEIRSVDTPIIKRCLCPEEEKLVWYFQELEGIFSMLKKKRTIHKDKVNYLWTEESMEIPVDNWNELYQVSIKCRAKVNDNSFHKTEIYIPPPDVQELQQKIFDSQNAKFNRTVESDSEDEYIRYEQETSECPYEFSSQSCIIPKSDFDWDITQPLNIKKGKNRNAFKGRKKDPLKKWKRDFGEEKKTKKSRKHGFSRKDARKQKMNRY